AVTLAIISATEPTIAQHHRQAAMARGLADAGLEFALWGLNHPESPSGVPDPLPPAAPAPYGGQTAIPLAVDRERAGLFRLPIAAGRPRSERHVAAVGWVPSDDPADLGPKSHQRVTATMVRAAWLNPPCALCARGDVHLGELALVDGRDASTCGG